MPQIYWVLNPVEVISCMIGAVVLTPFIAYKFYRDVIKGDKE